jgi:predicted TIM-barrel fold metal-dependent hydrolase
MKLISVDDHVIEHPRVWTDRLPAQYQEAGPRVIETSQETVDVMGEKKKRDNAHVWQYEGELHANFATQAVAGKPPEEWGTDPWRYEEIRPGCYDPHERLADMDIAGVHAQLSFPTFPRFAGTLFLTSKDKELGLLSVRAWNDFMIDEWCAVDPTRLIPMSILPLWDPQLAAAEIERVAAKGSKTITFPENPVPLGLPSWHTDHWDPVFAACQAADIPLSMHFGTSGTIPNPGPDSPIPVSYTLLSTASMSTALDLVFSPVFYKFPNLKVALSEGGIGWFPHVLEKADWIWDRHRYYTGVNTETRPSDLMRKHLWGCFIDDEVGLQQRHALGVGHIMWESDYPHSDTSWPNSRSRAEKMLATVPDEEAHRIVELNARELFHIDG